MKNLFCVALLYVSFFAEAQRLDLLPAAQTPVGLTGKYGIQFYETYPGSGVFQASAEKVKYTDLFAPLLFKGDSGALYTSRFAWQRYKDSMATVLANLKLVPSVAGHAGKYLVTDGSSSFWSPMGGLISAFFNDANYVKRDSGDVRYAAANHNHAGVYQPAGTYLTVEADPKRIVSIAITGTGTKTVTATLADGSTVSNTFTDLQGGSGGAQTDTTELSTRLTDVVVAANNLQVAKVDKITGKKLSTKDYTAADSLKLAGLQNGWPKDSVTKYITDSVQIVAPSWTAVNANYALTKMAPRITVDASAGAVSITLPSLPTGAGTDYLINVINNTNPVTIIGSVEGAANAIIRQKGVVILSADVSTYRMLHAAIIPRGGSTNQVLAKASSSDYDVAWTTPASGGGGGGGGGLTDDYLVADNSTAQSIPYGCYCWSTPSAGTVTVQGATSWNWDGSKGTVPHSGLYRVNFNVWFGDNVPSINIGTALQINSTGVYNQLWEMHARTDGSNRHSVSYQTEVYLTAGQTVEPKIYWEGDGWGIQAVHFAVIRER